MSDCGYNKEQKDAIDPTEPGRWKNRRRMAWLSLFSILAFTVALLFFVDSDRLSAIEEASTWFYMSMASIVGAYMGFSTWAAKK